MKRIALIAICLVILASCGITKKTDPNAGEVNRTSEEQLMDKKLTTVLREQLAGAYEMKGATFTFRNTDELEGKECFVYKMKNGEIEEVFAIATDASVIFHLNGTEFVKIFDIN